MPWLALATPCLDLDFPALLAGHAVQLPEVSGSPVGWTVPGVRHERPIAQRCERDSEVPGQVLVRCPHQGRLAGFLGEFGTVACRPCRRLHGGAPEVIA
jgi:hypothetical protein